MGRRRKASASRALVALLILLGVAAAGYLYLDRGEAPGSTPPPRAEGIFRVHYVDVGQGDGTIWELPDGSIVVYDCGPPAADVQSNAMTRYLQDALGKPPGSAISALFASHGHLDHVGGCEDIFESYVVEHVYEAWYEGDDAPASYARHLEAIRAEGASIHRLPALASGPLALPGVRATLLWPGAFTPGGWGAIAEASLVIQIDHGATSFCFQGDIEDRQERELTARCDVYLVGHHGSRSASSSGWLAQMGPQIAVVSFGENAYGHPHPEALCRIQQAGADVYATARRGTIVVESDGAGVRVLHGEKEAVDFCGEGAEYNGPYGE